MKSILPLSLVLLCLFCSFPVFSQIKIDTLYYSDARFWNKKEKQSDYMRIFIEEDGVETELQKNDKKQRLYLKKSYRADEPVGVWEKLTKDGVEYRDYDFDVQYSTALCERIEGQDPLKLLLFDIEKINYTNPKVIIKGEEKFFSKAFRRYFNPPKHWRTKALKGGLQIKVDLMFTVTETGEITDISVLKSQDVEIDKEVVRTLKTMSFDTPPKLDGDPIAICVVYPVRIHMRPNAM